MSDKTEEKKPQPKTVEEVRELVQCAAFNLTNLARALPGIQDHPFFAIVEYQLACANADDESEIFMRGQDPNQISLFLH